MAKITTTTIKANDSFVIYPKSLNTTLIKWTYLSTLVTTATTTTTKENK